jgi:hypothetical protein
VQALGSGITLDRALARSHAYGAPVGNPAAKTAGYQGMPAPNQWFGGTLATRAGSIALMDASGAVIVDGIVYGSQQSNSSANGTITSPELATLEAVQSQGGCIVVAPALPGGGRGAGQAADAGNRSVGRLPNGFDTDSLCVDFLLQPATTLSAAAAAGATNIKVAGVADFAAGQTTWIDTGADVETAVIATAGTAGATTLRAAIGVSVTEITVVSAAGFSAGQTIGIDIGKNQETAVVISTAGGGRGGNATITVAMPLRVAHSAGVQVSGSGIALTAPLMRAHAGGTQVAAGLPTPGASNQYYRKGLSAKD